MDAPRKHAFSQRIIEDWNTPTELIMSPAPSGVCDVLLCNFQNNFKISLLLMYMQLLLVMARNWTILIGFNAF